MTHASERTSSEAPRLRLTSMSDVVEMVPYLLGFAPVESLVLLGVEPDAEGDRIGVATRIDRADGRSADCVEQLFAALRRSGADRAIAVFYGAPPEISELSRMHRQARRAGCWLLDALSVTARQWRSLLCSDPRCCPPEGHALPAAPSPLQAAATYVGMVARADRAEVEALIEAAPERQRAELRPALQAAQQRFDQRIRAGEAGRAERSAVRSIFAASRRLGVLTEPQRCDFAVALRRSAVRDACWLAIDDRRIGGEDLWRELARSLPTPYDAAPLFLFGWLKWRAGNGTLASMAAERALAADADYTAAGMLHSAVQHGINPFQTPRLRRRRAG